MAGTPWEWWFPDGRAARRQHGAPRRLRGDGHGGGVLRNTLLRVGRRRCSTTCRMTPCSCWMRTSTRRRKATLPKSPGDTNRSAMTWSGRSFRPMLSTCGPGISRAHQTLRTSQDRSRRSTPSPPRGFRRKRLAGTGRQPPRPDPAARLRSFVGNADTRILVLERCLGTRLRSAGLRSEHSRSYPHSGGTDTRQTDSTPTPAVRRSRLRR